MNEDALLERISRTLRQEIGPAVEAEYPKTQAFMAAVVAHKLGRQLGLRPQHEAAARADRESLLADLNDAIVRAAAPSAVAVAVAELADSHDDTALCALIEALYASREELGRARFDALLARVRRTLRADIDRQMEYAR